MMVVHTLRQGDLIMANEIAKIPPQNVEAEQSVLGSLLLDKDALLKIADFLKPDDF